jgi:murein DD-endopeptidase MepM/ murein hydrolase activator NlpD
VKDDRFPLPLVALGAAGAFGLAALLRPRAAGAASSATAPPLEAPPPPEAPAPLFTFGRPFPTNVRAVVSSGWLAPRKGRLHRGLDIGGPTGTPILALDEGVVTRAVTVDRSDAGLWVAVQHPPGVTSRYIHLSRVLVTVGQRVQRGDAIGHCGATGNARSPHLHLDLRVPAAMLPAIERAIGKPRPGWGPEMRPFGHSIPGEPWVPVDAYRTRVRDDAAEAGIPLRDPSAPRNGTLKYRPVGERDEPYPEWLRAIRGQSGVYVIRERDRDGDPIVVYVGESSTGRLYETLTRHFQQWRRWKRFWGGYAGGHDPGVTYDRSRVEVAVKVTAPSDALDEEARLIRRLRPRDNIQGQIDYQPEAAEEVPF